MDSQSVFYEEWLRSLREQYKQVLRNNDGLTLSSLTAVMRNVGFRDDELARLRIEATMRAEDLSDDFSVDLSILDQRKTRQAPPAETACPERMTVDESRLEKGDQPSAPEAPAHDAEKDQVFPMAENSEIEAPADAEPVTFEDSVAAEAQRTDAAEAEPSGGQDEGEPDPDAPEQMSLF